MPCGDGTGPIGMGSMSGRGAGYCAVYDVPGCMNPMLGRGAGRGFRRGRGLRRGFRGGRDGSRGRGIWRNVQPAAYQQMEPDPGMEKEYLKNYAEDLVSELESVKKRLAEIDKKK